MPPRPEGDPEPLAYLDNLADRESGALAIQLEATLTTAQMRQKGLAPHILGARMIRKALPQIDRVGIARKLGHHLEHGDRKIGEDRVHRRFSRPSGSAVRLPSSR